MSAYKSVYILGRLLRDKIKPLDFILNAVNGYCNVS